MQTLPAEFLELGFGVRVRVKLFLLADGVGPYMQQLQVRTLRMPRPNRSVQGKFRKSKRVKAISLSTVFFQLLDFSEPPKMIFECPPARVVTSPWAAECISGTPIWTRIFKCEAKSDVTKVRGLTLLLAVNRIAKDLHKFHISGCGWCRFCRRRVPKTASWNTLRKCLH